MRRSVWLWAWLAACDGVAPPVPAEPASPTPEQPVSPQPPIAPLPDAPTPTQRPDDRYVQAVESIEAVEVPRIEGLPAVSEGPPIKLPSLAVTQRVVGKLKVPSVALADAASQQKLDELIERLHWRCQVHLALESLVSIRCVYIDEMSGEQERDSFHFRVGPAGDVAHVKVWELLHPGLMSTDYIKLLLRDPDADDRDALLTSTGLELTSSDDPVQRIPWRALAPHVRADGPLGPVVEAQGLPLAPVGTTITELPPVSLAIRSDNAATLARDWMGMRPALRAKARLVSHGAGQPAALVFAPDVGRRELPHHVEIGEGFFLDPTTAFIVARAEEPIALLAAPAAKDEVSVRLPAGTLLPVAAGPIGRMTSGIGARRWAFVGGRQYGDWVAGRSLVADDTCLAVPPVREGGALELHGITDLVRDGKSERLVWLAFAWGNPDRMELHLHPIEDCGLGPRTRTLAIGRRLTALDFTSTTADGGDTLVIAIDAPNARRDARTVLVFAPSSDEPVFRRELSSDAIEVGVERGPDRSPGWFPLVLGTGDARVWLTWNGTTLHEHHP